MFSITFENQFILPVTKFYLQRSVLPAGIVRVWRSLSARLHCCLDPPAATEPSPSAMPPHSPTWSKKEVDCSERMASVNHKGLKPVRFLSNIQTDLILNHRWTTRCSGTTYSGFWLFFQLTLHAVDELFGFGLNALELRLCLPQLPLRLGTQLRLTLRLRLDAL